MTQSSLSLRTSVLPNCSTQFVKWCAEEFQWKDLSEDVIMDIGCGVEMNCCKAILTQFPDVRTLIAVNKESTVFEQAHFTDRRINSCVGNILERDSLKIYEGKMNKIISADTFHQIYDKEIAFRNVYRLLKPGGEVGFFFVVNSWVHKFLTALSELPKYADILEGTRIQGNLPQKYVDPIVMASEWKLASGAPRVRTSLVVGILLVL
ncbi:hypothetical protein TNIN_52631 [Trichonephila inaurata madagascariensis]|uniref:Methyltransferase domain-containing protein n=1 Tax=Trichonephila inaurata madagascariensis TaxID=2747483 RepID=A0A8X6YNT8_9ARAC|nr:hypothetical protein TNIN_52631 [Trichonephila inaurata madagascariensis]